MILKSLILNVDPKEKNLGRVLLYGHLHAHVLERIANFSIPHSVSVWWGILIDLLLGGHEDIYSEIVDALSRHRWFGDTITNQISTVEESTFKTAIFSIFFLFYPFFCYDSLHLLLDHK